MKSVFTTALALNQHDSAAEALVVGVFQSEVTASERMLTIFREPHVPITATAAKRKIAGGSTTPAACRGSGCRNHRYLDAEQRR